MADRRTGRAALWSTLIDPTTTRGDRSPGQREFADATERYRHELRVHCYRMSGSLEESEDLVQEALLRAWRAWPRFRGESSVRTWLYRIATNVCLAHLDGRERRVLPFDPTAPAPPTPLAAPKGRQGAGSGRRWLEPFPDGVLPGAGGSPAELVEARETIGLAFLAALQALSTRERAAFVLRDVLGLPAREAAHALDVSVAAVKSALQRARAGMRRELGEGRATWSAGRSDAGEEQAVVERYVAALEERDARAMAELLHEDLRVAYLPRDLRVEGRDAFVDGSTTYAPAGTFRYLRTGANAQPAIAVYLRPPGAAAYRRLSLAVVTVAGGQIIEIVDYSDPHLLDLFGLPDHLRP